MTLQVPDDQTLLSVYMKGASTDAGFGSAYDGWAALWLDGYRDGALVRPNVESDASNVGQAWAEYVRHGMGTMENLAFHAGYAYGKRAVSKPMRWFPAVAIASALTIFVGGFLWGVIL